MKTTFSANSQGSVTVSQSENSAILYTWNWSSDLPTSVTVSSSTWTSEDSNVTIANTANTTTTASARLSASSPGRYRVVNKVVTSAGDTRERIIYLVVKANNPVLDYGFWR